MSTSFFAVTFDCADAARVAGFWSLVLDRPLDGGGSAEFASIGMEPAESGPTGGAVWMFHQVPESKAAKNRVHVDLLSDNRDKAVAHALDHGAQRLGDFDEGGYQWTTLADPEGNEFDIVAAPA
jgi:hypothetical protein